ncbi:unnamed protein product [Notodromas monacha]|uniref:RING finger protein 207 n=1 Tax=Notodromas monacha TaxID=399045 RepID=A0A7R9BPD2_9CRUS|nr:unnamed protein product [Notodromas monacha]CAG0918948.1 unnamed protein product [Notodromas monacha]
MSSVVEPPRPTRFSVTSASEVHACVGKRGGDDVRVAPTSHHSAKRAMDSQAPEDSELEPYSRNPLLCYLCNEVFDEPCLLGCYHTFCAKCVSGKAVDGKISCPLCGKVTTLKDGSTLPPPDYLVHYVVESSNDEKPVCANCDKADHPLMFFCDTCGQALCGVCRDETHRAKMFSQHDIIHMSKRTKEIHKKVFGPNSIFANYTAEGRCALHNEPFIMFSTATKSMLCINCFRDTAIDARLHCVDLDTAYTQGCKKLERARTSLLELQNSLRDGVILFRALLEELKRNMETEKSSILSTCQSLEETIQQTQEALLQEVDNQYVSKDQLFRSQLSVMASLLPTIHLHIIMCTTFSSSTSKFEFLDLGYSLMDRLAAISHMGYPLRPNQSSQVKSNYKVALAQVLEPYFINAGPPLAPYEGAGAQGGAPTTVLTNGATGASPYQSEDKSDAATSSSLETVREYIGGSRGSLSQNATQSGKSSGHHTPVALGPNFTTVTRRTQVHPLKMKILESSGPFPDHCKNFDANYREISMRFARLKDQVQELHRDVTMRRCLTKRGKVEEIITECATLDSMLRKHAEHLESMHNIFSKTWDDQSQRIQAERELYQMQMNDLMNLQSENRRVLQIVQQLEPYIRSISTLMERLSPHLHPGQLVSVGSGSGAPPSSTGPGSGPGSGGASQVPDSSEPYDPGYAAGMSDVQQRSDSKHYNSSIQSKSQQGFDDSASCRGSSRAASCEGTPDAGGSSKSRSLPRSFQGYSSPLMTGKEPQSTPPPPPPASNKGFFSQLLNRVRCSDDKKRSKASRFFRGRYYSKSDGEYEDEEGCEQCAANRRAAIAAAKAATLANLTATQQACMAAASKKRKGKPTGMIGYGPTSFFVEASDYDNLCRNFPAMTAHMMPPRKEMCVGQGCERVGQGLYCALGCGDPASATNTAVPENDNTPRRKSEGSSSCSSVYCKKCGPVYPKGQQCPDPATGVQDGAKMQCHLETAVAAAAAGVRSKRNGSEKRSGSSAFPRNHAVPKSGGHRHDENKARSSRCRQTTPQRSSSKGEQRQSPYETLDECKLYQFLRVEEDVHKIAEVER